MAIEFKTDQGVAIAVLSETLDETQGRELTAQIEGSVPKGGKLIVDGSALRTLTQQGVLALITAQHWTSVPERKRLPLVGFDGRAWRAIRENGSDFFFESKSNLADALLSLGAVAPAAADVSLRDDPALPVAARSAPGADVDLGRRIPPSDRPRSLPEAKVPEPFPEPVPAPVPQTAAYTPSTLPPEPPRASRKATLITALLLLSLAAVVVWWLANPSPKLTLSASSTVAEEDGRDVDEITAMVAHGRLTTKDGAELPKGIYFEPPSEESGGGIYTLRGRAEPGTKSTTVALEAVGNSGQRSLPAAFTVTVQEKPMSWQLGSLQTLGLKEGERIWYQAKFLVNADKVVAKAGLPPGLVVERIPGKNRDWQIAGTPTVAGNYQVVFSATSPTGKQEEQTCPLKVGGEPVKPPVVQATPTAAVVQTTPVAEAAIVAATPSPSRQRGQNVDDGMRLFLLDRIENLPSSYTDEDRDKLRAVVGTLQQARLIDRVVFERDGQVELSPDQAAKLRMTLKTLDNAALLENSYCQIVVVGYASRTGSLAGNVRISKARARTVSGFLRSVIGRGADLCGDYGPTGVVDQSADEHNRAVEVYAGMLKPSSDLQADAARFKEDFNRRHGIP